VRLPWLLGAPVFSSIRGGLVFPSSLFTSPQTIGCMNSRLKLLCLCFILGKVLNPGRASGHSSLSHESQVPETSPFLHLCVSFVLSLPGPCTSRLSPNRNKQFFRGLQFPVFFGRLTAALRRNHFIFCLLRYSAQSGALLLSGRARDHSCPSLPHHRRAPNRGSDLGPRCCRKDPSFKEGISSQRIV